MMLELRNISAGYVDGRSAARPAARRGPEAGHAKDARTRSQADNISAAREAEPLGGLVLRGLSLAIPASGVTCIMGRNGAGKSTLMKAIMGLVPLSGGEIRLDGTRLDSLPAYDVPRQGVGYVPQGRRLFGEMTVAENLEIGRMVRNSPAEVRERVLALFPRLAERMDQMAASLSGGEQQMLAIGRALCLEPKVLLLDEPSEGLQPSMISLIREVVLRLKAEGVAVVLVEQRVETALQLADRIAFMAQGRVAEVIEAAELSAAHPAFKRYVGV